MSIPLRWTNPTENASTVLFESRWNKTKITFEYILIDGVNDSEQDAKKLVSLISGINSKINLIPFNPWEGCSFTTSRENRISKFSNVLKQKGYDILIRRSKGSDVDAACGQLKMRNL